jgi:pimeloyl-ACP methyl ester carboxylesterase
MKFTAESTSTAWEADGLRLHYHEAGQGETVVMLHGGGPGASGWSNFHRNIDAFAGHFRVLVPDLPGFGRSSKPFYEERIGRFNAGVLKQWLDTLGIAKVRFVGNSMGGHVALQFALDYPEMVHSLVLMAPALPVATLASNPTEGAKVLRGYYHGEGPSLERMRAFLGSLVYEPQGVDEATLRDRFERSIEPETVEWSKRMAPRPERFEPLWKELERVGCPTLLVWGRDDRVVPLDRGLFMLHQLPDARLHVFGRCGHWAMLEKPEAFNQLCLDFLA